MPPNTPTVDPFQQALMDLEAVLGELRASGTEAPGDEGMGQNALASQMATQAQFPQSAPQNALAGYSVNQPVEPVSVAQDIPPEQAASLVGVNSASAGLLPYAVAGIKRMTGYDDGKDFDTLRREEQMRVEGARNALGPAALPVEMLTPAGGVGMLMKGAKTANQLAQRAGMAGAIYGGIRGAADPIEPDSLDVGERLTPALWGGAMGGAMGYAGGRAAGAASDVLNSRAAARSAEAAKPSPAELRARVERGRLAVVAPEGATALPPVERFNQIGALYAQGQSIPDIASQIGESAESVAQTVIRANAPGKYSQGSFKVQSPKILADAEKVMQDVEAFRNAPQPRQRRVRQAEALPAPVESVVASEPTTSAPKRSRTSRETPERASWITEQVNRLTPEERTIARQQFLAMQGDAGIDPAVLPQDLSDADILRGWRRWQARNDQPPVQSRGRAANFRY